MNPLELVVYKVADLVARNMQILKVLRSKIDFSKYHKVHKSPRCTVKISPCTRFFAFLRIQV